MDNNITNNDTFSGFSLYEKIVIENKLNKNESSTIDSNINNENGNLQDFHLVLPCIILFGLIGNILSLVTILHSRLRKTNASAYLIVLTASDSLFLITLLLVLFQIDFYSFYSCTLIEYLLSTSASVSSWSIAGLTIERFSAIVYPLKHVTYGHIDRFKMIIFWLPIPFLYNLIYFVGLETNEIANDRKCKITDGISGSILMIIDIALNYLFPCVTVVALNFLTASNIGSTSNYFGNYNNTKEKSIFLSEKIKKSKANISNNVTGTCSNIKTSSIYVTRRSIGNGKKNIGTTRILWVVPFVYIILNTPYYTFQIIDRISEGAVTNYFLYSKNPFLVILNNVLLYLYYFNFASDVLVYAFSSKMFRKTVLSVWKKMTCQKLYNGVNSNNHFTNYTRSPRKPLTEIDASGFNSIRKENISCYDIYSDKKKCRLKNKN
ncbi:G protein-coupled receptor, rhodopsin-like family and GPCR, rhodopsin-like, 7TM domain-containing protein [Strongyloides ratti]|uniref:G protein-coupled receptor, rhodopsin-like family and GPCR, rhodopsin-like, 7TM domain-containing protein n=1 Tax=Strongyloides ratti TaxID=34506 RepID=A0A090L190_STRRB|nr:G protein-coupled receptor, rhodopsin-like family and GPCR, rhodopsin-like, 7TM domain-containing protein [Strongyloides ratti]CEF61204.1 G protein-coupled receptor, rhodopsin-like family and GPCR, rhodopsin-like, 7TM domain-containing protein [Strongyloides ratti]